MPIYINTSFISLQLRENFNDLFSTITAFDPAMLSSAQLLFSNNLRGPMNITPGTSSTSKLMSAIVVHTQSVISCKKNCPFFQLLIKMTNDPASLSVSILVGAILNLVDKLLYTDILIKCNFLYCNNNRLIIK